MKLNRRNWVKPVPFWMPAAMMFSPLAMVVYVLGGFQFPYWAGFSFTFAGMLGMTMINYYYHKRMWQLEQIILKEIFTDIAEVKARRGASTRL